MAMEMDQEMVEASLRRVLPTIRVDEATLGMVRKLVAKDLSVDDDAVKAYRSVVKEFVTNHLDLCKKTDVEEEEAADIRAAEEAEDSGSEAQVSEDEPETPVKRKRRSDAENGNGKKQKVEKTMEPKGVRDLKDFARAAGILGPVIYKQLKEAGSATAKEGVLREKIADKGLSFQGKYPTKDEVNEMKRKKELEKELDGMDTSKILSDGPRSRRRSTQRAELLVDPSDEDGTFPEEQDEAAQVADMDKPMDEIDQDENNDPESPSESSEAEFNPDDESDSD